MARYSNTIQDILMMYCVHKHNIEPTSTKEIITTAQKDLFDFDYEFYDPLLKDEFEKQFIRHFYMREIAYESIALFKLKLQDYLDLNMYKWAIIYQRFNGLDPFVNFDVMTERKTDEDESKNNDLTRNQSLDNHKDQTQTNLLDTDASRDDTRKQDETGKTTGKQDTKTQNTSEDFTRQLGETTPDDRLSITAEDGKGLIQYADSIDETRGTTSQNQTEGMTSSNDTILNTNETNKRVETRKQVEDRHLKDSINQTQDTTQQEEIKRAFLQELSERKHGKIGNVTYMSMYSEFVKNFDAINKQLFKELNKVCFIGLLN